MQGQVADSEPQTRYSLHVLQTIRSSQVQNGLKQGELQPDYTRYRHHCTNALRSLYLSLKFTHGKGKYQKRKLEPHNVTDVRYLHIPLLSAERSWAFAMELKKEGGRGNNNKRRKHAIKRFAKAALWASELARLAAERSDSRTIVETEAYLAWMQGHLLLEKGKEWDRALAKYTRARKLWQGLSEVVDLAGQGACLAAVEDVDPLVRYAEHQIKGAGQQDLPPLPKLTQLGDDGVTSLNALQAQLQELAAATAASLAAAARSNRSAGGAESLATLEWRGRKLTVRSERVKVTLSKVSDIEARLSGSMEVDGGAALEERLALYNQLQAALGEVRAALANAAKADNVDSTLEAELSALDVAVTGMIHEAVIARTRLQLNDMEERFAAGLERRAAGKKIKDKEARKFGRAEDLVRVATQLLRSYQELADLGLGLGGRQGEALHDVCAAQVDAVRALRTYAAGHVYLAQDQWQPALALFGEAQQRAVAAAERLEELSQQGVKDEGAEQWRGQLQTLEVRSEAWRAVGAAEVQVAGCKREETVSQGVGGLSLDPSAAAGTATHKGGRYLLEASEEWQSFAGDKGRSVRLFPVPPRLQSVAVPPIMLDTAWAHVDYPSLEHRVKKEQKKGWFTGSWFGAQR